jgi:3'-5' exoribonuclease
MSRRFVTELNDGEIVDQIFRAAEKQLRTNRNGNLYLQIRLSDRSGSLTAMLWNAQQRDFDRFDNGDFLRVKGTAQIFNGGMQILCKEVQRVDEKDVDASEFETLSTLDREKMVARVAELLRSIGNEHLLNLADCFLLDEKFMQGFRAAPAGVKNHHAYQGGLLEHVLSLMELVQVVAQRYSALDRDVLMFGAFLHDIGKIRELTYDPDLGYSDEGQLIGHLVLGVSMLDEMIGKVEEQTGQAVPPKLVNHLRHLIVSHHGDYEFGSPKLPMTVEAVALHLLDTLDARMHSFLQLIADDANKASPWTVYHANLGRKILKHSKAQS